MTIKICLIVFAFITFSCSTHYVYTPTPQNIPYLENKNETSIRGQLASGIMSPSISFNGSIAHSITKNIGILSNATHSLYRYYENTDYRLGGKITYFDLGLGYFTFTKNNYLHLNSYGGLGYGLTKNIDKNSNIFFETNFLQPYLLFSLGFINELKFAPSLYLSCKFSHVNYYKIGKIKTEKIDLQYNYNILNDKNKYLYIEPAITIRKELEVNLSYYIQCVWSLNQDRSNIPNGNNLFITAGFEFLLPYDKK